MKIMVIGDSIAEGLGVKGMCYADLLRSAVEEGTKERILLQNLSHTGYQISDSEKLLPVVIASKPNLIIIAHGVSEAIIRPNKRALRLVPTRWREKGWLDPRPYFSKRLVKKLYHLTESEIRWRYKVALIKNVGGETWMTPEDFAMQMQKFITDCLIATDARIILVSHSGIDDVFFPGSSASLELYKKEIYALAADMKNRQRVHICDISLSLQRWEDYFADHFHPNAKGHAKIAEALHKILSTEAMKSLAEV